MCNQFTLQKIHTSCKSFDLKMSFVATYRPAVQDLKKAFMANWSLIENRPLMKTIFKRPSIRSYKRGKSLKDMLVRAKM